MAAVSEQAKQNARDRNKLWRQQNKDKIKAQRERNGAAQAERYRKKDPTRFREQQRKSYYVHHDANLKYQKDYRERDDTHAIANERWWRENPHVKRAHAAKRRAAQRQHTPSWANQQHIQQVYAEAERLTVLTGIKHVVDHIVPLHNPLVCGLHVENNLQVLTWKANSEKSNKFTV